MIILSNECVERELKKTMEIIETDWFVGSKENYLLLAESLNDRIKRKRPKGF